jgi:hypothetical protein
MIIVPLKEHSQCDISGRDVTFRQEPQRSSNQNAALPAGSVPLSIQGLTRKRDSGRKGETELDSRVTFGSEAGETGPQHTPLALTHLNFGTPLVAHDQNKAAALIRSDLFDPLQIDESRPSGAKESS